MVDSIQLNTAPSQTPKSFKNAKDAVDHLVKLYDVATEYLHEKFQLLLKDKLPLGHYRAFYPLISLESTSYSRIDRRLSFGHVTSPGIYETTVTRPDLFYNYLIQQLELIIANHNIPITISYSDTPIPIHFALPEVSSVSNLTTLDNNRPLRDYFDAPDLRTTNDAIANGDDYDMKPGLPKPLAAFTAQRVDYSLARLSHYTSTDPSHFQNFVLFTNYQFYIDEFIKYGMDALVDDSNDYESLVFPGHIELFPGDPFPDLASKMPQMPAYHLKRKNGSGITLVNIGVGPSNAKTITDHIAVLRPHAWIMVGHCAGLRQSQNLGDYVLAHAYVRDDHVLDADLPVWVPLPALAEIQVTLEQSVAEITGYEDYELKRIMRTGTVASIDDRNWELREYSGPIRRLSQSRAIALDMESATIAANGFRFRVPYGTLLCVSDKPLHGELKLPGMASEFYQTQVAQHLQIGIRTMEKLSEMPLSSLHSRKLRSFDETAFL